MTRKEQIRFRNRFLKEAGANVAMFADMLRELPDAAFYIKDASGRIVTLNQRNCEICSLADEFEAVGFRSDQLFASSLAAAYMEDDTKVLQTGKPLVNVLSPYPNDYSENFEYKSVYPVRNADGKVIGTACLYRLVPNPEKVPSWHGLMKRITGYINDHYAENLTVEHLAKLAGTSASKFTRAFVRTFDVSPGRYVANIRLTAARQLLESSDKPLVDIAQETGFYDLSHFTRAFKRERKTTPGQYRRHYQSMCRDK